MEQHPLTPEDYRKLVPIFMKALNRAERIVQFAETRQEPLSFQLRRNFETLKIAANDTISQRTIEYSLANEEDHASEISGVISTSAYYAHLKQNACIYGPGKPTIEQHIRSNRSSIAGYKVLQKITNQFGFIFT
ncbi:MAG: hypothetical protein AUJ12_07695 [Alphaproteobacteria bacterium CG1_02_46_17]|nr:MAG: hypothetical protein AUJ12_07695 [Alphaproteobacteria bacterium CG1_02_46_17]